jgi:hypothetical protein
MLIRLAPMLLITYNDTYEALQNLQERLPHFPGFVEPILYIQHVLYICIVPVQTVYWNNNYTVVL